MSMLELFVKLSGSWMVVEMPSEPSSFCGTNSNPSQPDQARLFLHF